MHGHQEVEAVLDALQKQLSVIDINVEFSLERIVNKDACLNVDHVILAVPVGLEGNWHAVPSVGISMAQTITHALDDTLSKDVWL